MKRMFTIICFLLPSIAFGQGAYYSNIVLNRRGIPLGSVTITVCTAAGTLINTSVNLSPGCTRTVSIYSDPALRSPQANPFKADGQGNFNFYVTPGTYTYSVTGPTATATLYTIVLPIVSNSNITLTGLKKTCFADGQSGANAGAKIVACIATFPSSGGIIDARGFLGAQTITANPFAGVTKPVTLLLGAATFTVSDATVAAERSIIELPSNSSLIGLGKDITTIKLAANAQQSVNVVGAYQGARVLISNLTVDGNATNQTNGQHGIVFNNGVTFSTVRNVHVTHIEQGSGIVLNTPSAANHNTDNTVEFSEVDDYGVNGGLPIGFGIIAIASADRNRIIGNTVTCGTHGNTGIASDGSNDDGTGAPNQSNTISNNVVIGPCITGILVEDADYTIVDSNQITAPIEQGILIHEGQSHHKPIGNSVTNNKILDANGGESLGGGIAVRGDFTLIAHNLIRSGTNFLGIVVGPVLVANRPSQGNKVIGNSIDSLIIGAGVLIEEGSNILVAENQVSNVTGASGYGIAVYTAATILRIEIQNNITSNTALNGIFAAVNSGTIQDISITGNTIINAGVGAGAASTNAIQLNSGGTRPTVSFNMAIDTQATTTTKNLLGTNGAVTLIQAVGNRSFATNGTIPLYGIGVQHLAP